ncbi:hypothetical protein [Methylovorus glucosotrophus]|uniref:Uncharacterized protein n=1 Tax=Methylovorus glucosotrophus (strain SIP3-4) TaxID=582744 RepID=C6X7W1_METGS|nr:hypothetical protein [Methylovorus glucosotrophus]ACT51288.1 hypothetical protein Msip34_2046 [Methylovorus glucosotrophus SIP3-4]
MKNNQAIVVKDNHKLIYSYDDLDKIKLYENALHDTYELNTNLIKENKVLKICLAILFICIAILGVNL